MRPYVIKFLSLDEVLCLYKAVFQFNLTIFIEWHCRFTEGLDKCSLTYVTVEQTAART